MAEYTPFSLNEAPVWGAAETPLLPPEWEPHIGSCVVPGVYRAHGPQKIGVPLGSFCRKQWSQLTFLAPAEAPAGRKTRRAAPTRRSGPFGELARPVLKCVQLNLSLLGDTLNGPLFTKRVIGCSPVLGIPVLRATKRRLTAANLLGSRLADFLSAGTFEELLPLVGRLRESLDLWMTARMWLADNGDGVLSAMQPLQATNVLDAFRLVRMRNFRQLGVPTSSSHYTVEMAEAVGCRVGLWEEGSGTLEQASCILGLTKQRMQQLEKTFSGLAKPRSWGVPIVLRRCARRIRRQQSAQTLFKSALSDRVDDLSRFGVIQVLRFCGASIPRSSQLSKSVDTALAIANRSRADVVAYAYELSGKFGFIRQDDLIVGLAQLLPSLAEEELAAIALELGGRHSFPRGYLFLHASRRTWVTSRIINLLCHLRRVAGDELHGALERSRVFYKRPPMPPKEVLKAFLSHDGRFVLEDNHVTLRRHRSRPLRGVSAWMASKISASGLQAIHRTALLAEARKEGVNGSTVSVYCSYSLLFKPVGRGCIALTGTYPTADALEIANAAARAIRVNTGVLAWQMEPDGPVIRLRAGNDLIDSGIITLKKEIRQFLQGRDLRVVSEVGDHGHARISGAVLYGLISVCSSLGIVPGDVVRLVVKLSNNHLLMVSDHERLEG
jgi:hypothetical protein